MTTEEFLSLWRTLKGFEPLCDDCSVTVTDGLNLDTVLRAEMDLWYHRLLREAPVDMLCPEELAGEIIPPPVTDGIMTLALPPEVVRVTCVKLSGWRHAVADVNPPTSVTAVLRSHPFTRAGADAPAAVIDPSGRLSLSPATDFDTIETLRCVTSRHGVYTFHPAALGLIPRNS